LFNVLWVVSFAALGAVNLYVAYHFDEATWVNFKLFGTIAWVVATVLLQVGWIWLWLKLSARPQPADDAR
jgi:intracellular septation protein